MEKHKIHIQDSLFSHALSSSYNNEPKEFEWVRAQDKNLVIFTDSHVSLVDNINSEKKIAWLLESPLVTPQSYEYIKSNFNKFDKIFTFDKDVLDSVDNSELLPIGGCWIDDDDKKVYNKKKLLSIISSKKNQLPGHRLRHDCIKLTKNIDVFGNGYNEIEKKVTGLKDYMFSIVIENCKKDYYFTEKIIDCFMTGTIPIYWGCPSIGKFFDSEGIITFDNLNELDDIVSSLSEITYKNKIDSVYSNFEKSKSYTVADNILYEKINI